MNRALRVLMGVSIVSILVPAMAMVMPDTLSKLNPWDGGNEPELIAAAEEDRLLGNGGAAPAVAGAVLPPSPSEVIVDTDTEGEGGTSLATDTSAGHDQHSDTTEGHDHSGTTATGGHGDHENPGSQDSTKTTHGSDHGESPIVEGSISGSACPCTVAGTVELKGTIDLRGDITVQGGTLVARSGVTVNGNGYQIMFMNGGKADFQGTKTSTWSGNGSNVNVKRDINFNNMRRIMFHQGAGKSVLRYFTISNSGNSGVLGDYPLHFHLNGNTTRGTLVEGVVVVNGRHHAFVPHGSHGITFKDTIAKDIRDDAYWWDPEGTNGGRVDNSNDIVFDHALAANVSLPHGADGFHRVSGFVLGDGSGNVVRGSAAVKIAGGDDCSGFQWPEKAEATWTFSNNYSSSSDCHGIFVWQNNGNTHTINGFSGSGISHGAYLNRYEYRNVDVPYAVIHATGWKVVGGHIGTVTAARHRNEGVTAVFTNVTIDRFVIANAGNGGDVPGHYVLTNTGITCDSIVYSSVVAGTKVVVNGAEC